MDSSARSIQSDNKNIKKLSLDKNILSKIGVAQCGFTIIELILVIAILSLLTTVAYGVMTGLEYRVDTQTSIDKLTSEIKSHKLKAMLGAYSQNNPPSGTAVYFHPLTNKYTLFICAHHAPTCFYESGNTTNTDGFMEKTITFSDITLRDNTVVFEPKSGQIRGYSGGQNSVSISNVADATKYSIIFSETGSVQVIKMSK